MNENTCLGCSSRVASCSGDLLGRKVLSLSNADTQTHRIPLVCAASPAAPKRSLAGDDRTFSGPSLFFIPPFPGCFDGTSGPSVRGSRAGLEDYSLLIG